jgi:predicted peptidase
MRIQLLLTTAGLLSLGLAPVAAAESDHGFLEKTYRSDDGKESKYTLFVPYDYKGDKPYPLIVYLHGSGEGGTDGKRPANVGLGPAIRKQEKTFPFLAVFPQSHNGAWKADSEDAKRVVDILDDVQKTYQVDPKRVSLTGMSSGGDGTWALAVKYPDRWAAIAPVCGDGDPAQAAKIKDISCWCFMGAADGKADVENAHAMIKALKDVGADPQYTEYPGVGHGIWNKVYGTPELYDWFAKQHRK